MGNELRFVCREMPGAGDECVFVECEDASGNSVKAGEWRPRADGLAELVVKLPAELHQGEPVALPARRRVRPETPAANLSHIKGWNACLDEIAKLGPLYTHPAPADQQEPVARLRCYQSAIGPKVEVIKFTEQAFKPGREVDVYTRAAPGEVEQLSKIIRDLNDERDEIGAEAGRLRAQLAELDALLRECQQAWKAPVIGPMIDVQAKIDAALSASAEPSAPVERDELPEFARTVIAKLMRLRDCAEDGQDADIGRNWFDTLVQLGLLHRVQRSPARWEITCEGDALIEARAALERKP